MLEPTAKSPIAVTMLLFSGAVTPAVTVAMKLWSRFLGISACCDLMRFAGIVLVGARVEG